ncbi:ABC transporter ATP-binding protein [Neptunitalea lumnitzerae]|nr:ATP-binding cassette domain-containing protein [Neptunitalea sp. Y10]
MSETEVQVSDIFLKEEVLFEKGQQYLVVAHSGHGKTSILNIIYGSNTAYQGAVNYVTTPPLKSPFEVRKSHLSYVFQDFKLFTDLSLFENIWLKNVLTHHKTKAEIEELIDKVQLLHKKDALVKNLSLGQRQRVAIVRALCQPFDFILLDEPFSHLDTENIHLVANLITDELKANNAGLIHTSLDGDTFFNYDKVLSL